MALHYKSEHTDTPRSRKIIRQMLALIPALVIAAACYSVSVYAWFQASIVNSGNVIQTTTYDIAVTIAEAGDKEIEAVDGVYHLKANTEYAVSLTAAGGGEKGGYCVIQPEDGALIYTEPIAPNQSLSFTLIPDKEQTYTFKAVWGKYTGDGKIITNKAVIGTEPVAPVDKQAVPTDDTGSSEPVGTTAPEPQATTQPTESSPNPAETTTAVPSVSDSTSVPSSAVTSELQSSKSAVPDTTSSQAAEPEVTASVTSDLSAVELIRTESEAIETVEIE